ncbi:MAG: lysine--tRNA ligase [Acidimicrobiales bacterium]
MPTGSGATAQPAPPYTYAKSAEAGEVAQRFAELGAGSGSGETVSVAGRVMLLRDQGKVAFAELRDHSGHLQLFATSAETPDFGSFCALALGDWVGASGEVVRTRRGEVSVKVAAWQLLARAQRSFGDKWRGITDPDTRYRQREVDLWANPESRRAFLLRSQAVSAIRRFMEARGFIEVETPIFHPQPGGANARPFVTHHHALDMDLYLRIAPELYLKRLVVGGFERVFEIGRVFRNEGLDTRHNPEFTMLEAYQAYADYHDAMALVEEMVAEVSSKLVGTSQITYGGRLVDLRPPWRRATMTELIAERTGTELSLEMGAERLRAEAKRLDVAVQEGAGPGRALFEVYEKTTEPGLWGPVFVCDYPLEVSPLSREHRSKPGMVERFEAVVAGRELVNAFSELVDPAEQRLRFEAQVAERARGDAEAMTVDEEYLRAMEHGLPPTAGLGLGIDRLAMLLADAPSIRDVLLFPTLRRLPGPQA